MILAIFLGTDLSNLKCWYRTVVNCYKCEVLHMLKFGHERLSDTLLGLRWNTNRVRP